MLDELAMDLAAGTLYISSRLSAAGRTAYEQVLREAITKTDETWLAEALRAHGRRNTTESRRKPSGGFTTAKVPVNAPETLAEGEFNRFYARGVCRRAVEDAIPKVVVYRAKLVVNPRPESQSMIGSQVDARALLEDLRAHQGVEPALRLPPGPNSGLSVRLP
ncbi:MAG: hypothetical protein ACYC1C_01960 [Chloroflexota bacterium]